jgi:hypothetical protein
MRLSFVWWNTSLSPPVPAKRNRASTEQRDLVCTMVDFILNGLGVDFLALGEMADEDLKAILDKCQLDGFRPHNGLVKVGRSQFDTCFIYRLEKLELLDDGMQIFSTKGNRTLKIAQRADFIVADCGTLIHVFVSHWPSRLWCEENSADRHLLGIRLRDKVEEVSSVPGKLANVILMGDYNDEPFDVPLAEQLMATRDRNLVRKKHHLLYNPFWRQMVSPELYAPGHEEKGGCGTCFHKGGDITRWRTFDQIMFSSAFLGSGAWHLNERVTGILELPGYAETVVDADQIFDHFPVIGVIDRVD